MYEDAPPHNESVYVPPKAPVYRPPAPEPVRREAAPGVGYVSYFLSMSGRMSQGQHFLASLFLLFSVGALAGFMGLGHVDVDVPPRPSQKLREIIGGALMLLSLYSLICVRAKRWHDRGMSAFMGFASLIPIVGPMWVFYQVWLMPGDGMNRYGPEVDHLGWWPQFGGGDGTKCEAEGPTQLLHYPNRF